MCTPPHFLILLLPGLSSSLLTSPPTHVSIFSTAFPNAPPYSQPTLQPPLSSKTPPLPPLSSPALMLSSSVSILSPKKNSFNSNAGEARYFASLVPLVNCSRLIIHGLSLADDQSLVKSVTREGNPKELLRGPLYYVVMLMLCALVFWRESPVGLIALGMMCGGDGFADIMGRKFGSSKIPYNQTKSWVGSISMLVSGFFVSIGMVWYYSALGYFQMDWGDTVQRVALVSLVATVVESLPISNLIDDNISVPLASMLAAYLTFTH
ncbi:hypothetical protein V6N13_142875 [Hibiscus sabdariffa]|uniref:phytol kinase n=1 Tax=Hibiscus sabdariffa TaxID=183260 RepID=A0ABR2FFK6_9ROSI